MNKIIIKLVVLPGIIGFMSCHEDDLNNNMVMAQKNNIAWHADVQTLFDPAYGDSVVPIDAKKYNAEGHLRENLVFIKVPLSSRILNLYPAIVPNTYFGVGASYFTFEGDGHVISESFYIDTTKINYFNIESFNSSNNEFKISFEANFITRNHNMNPEVEIEFSEGNINTIIQE